MTETRTTYATGAAAETATPLTCPGCGRVLAVEHVRADFETWVNVGGLKLLALNGECDYCGHGYHWHAGERRALLFAERSRAQREREAAAFERLRQEVREMGEQSKAPAGGAGA